METKKVIERLAHKKGADYFGVAGLQRAAGKATTPYEAKMISKYPAAISIGVSLLSGIVDGLADSEDYFALKNYYYHVYQVINPRINEITLEIGRLLMDKGFNSLIIPASQTVDITNLTGLFSLQNGGQPGRVGMDREKLPADNT